MPTARQKRAMEIKLQRIKEKKPIVMKDILLEAGYSPSIAETPCVITRSKGWRELLAEINDEPLLKKLQEIALDSKDKRASIAAIKELLTLKDRYPAQKMKMTAYDEREEVLE